MKEEKKEEEIVIDTEAKFLDFITKLDDYDYVTGNVFAVNNIVVSMKIEGDNFNSSLTGSMIMALAEYQNKIYDIYRRQKYGDKSTKRLSDDELRALEIKVEIKPGCTDVVLTFIKDIVPEVLNRMSGEEIAKATITIVGIIAAAWAVKGLGSTAIKEALKTKRAGIKVKEEVAKTEKEKKFLEAMESVSNAAIEGMRSVATGIVVSEPHKIQIAEQPVSIEQAQATIEEMKKPRIVQDDGLPDMYTVQGFFKVLNMNYENAVTLMKAQFVNSNEIFDDISLMNDWLTKENMKILEDAQNREPVWFRIILQRESGRKRFYKSIDVHSIDTSKKYKLLSENRKQNLLTELINDEESMEEIKRLIQENSKEKEEN